MSRSTWKPIFFDPKLWNASTTKTNSVNSQVSIENELICTKRSTPVLPFIVGRQIYIANGIRLTPTRITAERVGHRLGEFSGTRKRSSTNTFKQTSSTKK